MTKWQRLLVFTGAAALCLIAVMVLLVGLTFITPPAEAGVADSRTVTHFSNLWAENYFTIDDQGDETVSANEQIDPSGSYQPLTAAGAVNAGLVVGSSGDFCYLVNTSANAITITDQTTCALAGDAVLAQYDSLTVICDGTRWVELSRSNN